MSLPNTFQFSQSSLQDFETCPRRFKLRYLDQLRWPAIESEPVQESERLAQLGKDFHRLVHQHLVGLDETLLSDSLPTGEPELQTWWESYLAYRPASLDEAELYPEVALSVPIRGFRLLARFDLLACLPDGTFLIVDWKTSGKRPPREFLARRIQTRVYSFVLAAAGAAFNHGQPIDPAAVRMLYWYPQFPQESEEFAYSQTQQKADEQFLIELIERIKHAAERDDFPLAIDEKPCSTCVYRSHCNRGVKAGEDIDAVEEDVSVENEELLPEWDQIAEIQF